MNRNRIIALIVLIVVVLIGIIYFARQSSDTTSDTLYQSGTASNNTSTATSTFALTSSAFTNNSSIPKQYTCDAASTNPPLTISNVPAGTQSFALTMYDPDVPTAVLPQGYFNHWVAFNIPATTTTIMASSTVGILGNNGANKLGYTGPCPPPQYEPKEHRYIFTVYALDNTLNLKQGATREQVESAVQGHTLGKAELIGRYQKASQ